MSDLDTLAEAIRQADPMKLHHNQQRNRYLEDYRRMAQAAIDALQLKEEKRNIRSICDMADTVGIDKRRWVTPWTEVSTEKTVQPYPSARVRAALAEAYDRSAPPMGWPYPPKVTQA